MALKIVDELCTSCGDCEPDCPTASISVKGGVYKINAKTCTECEPDYDEPKCIELCPVDRLRLNRSCPGPRCGSGRRVSAECLTLSVEC